MKLAIAFLAACVTGAPAGAQFEVVSVKPSPPPAAGMAMSPFSFKGGPGTDSPTRYAARGCLLRILVQKAFDVEGYQIAGLDGRNQYDIEATMAPATTNQEFHEMLRSMLIERFHLQAHRETREATIFRLEVGKGGPKFQETLRQGSDDFFEMAQGL